MSHLKYMKELSTLTKMDEAIKGPMPRWQKKCLETSSNSSINMSLNSSKKSISSISVNTSSTGRTPVKPKSASKKTPSKGTKKSPSRSGNTPSKTTGLTADRFIPNRATTNFDLGYYKLQQQKEPKDDEDEISPAKKELQRIIGENMNGGDVNNMRVLSYKNKAPAAPEGFQNPLRIVYTQSKTPASVRSACRYIPQTPDRILDAPEILDDYYLNLVDWSQTNILAVALHNYLYLWNATNGNIEQLYEPENNDYICSVAWVEQGPYLALGMSNGSVHLWDCQQMKRVRVLNGHALRVPALAWNSHILSSGCRGGVLIHHDVRQREHIIMQTDAHYQEICGLKWSPDGKYLASGGNDNVLNIWQSLEGSRAPDQPLFTMNQHNAAVKAIAWCPWQPNVLASGGGTADRTIRLWNCNNGSCIGTTDTKSQVCALLWSTTHKELVSGHGYAQNQVTIWKYPAMTKVAELTGHTSRVLHLAISPDGSTLLSAGADETLRLWKCFQPEITKKKEKEHKPSSTSRLATMIR